MPAIPAVQYARTEDGVDIPYWVVGHGSPVVFVPHAQMSHLCLEWEFGGNRRWFEAMARHHRLVRFDFRGGSLASRADTDFSIAALVRDVEAVVKREALERFALFGCITGGLPAIAFAARYPEQVSHLVLWNSFARNADHGGAPRMQSLFAMAAADWDLFCESISQAALGWSSGDESRRWAELVRTTTTQERFLQYLEARPKWDVSELLPKIEAPTLVLHDPRNALASEERCRELAASIPNASLQSADSDGGMPGAQAVLAIKAFVGAGQRAHTLDGLTSRETEVLALVATGASNAEIANRLSISVNTVTRHLTHIYSKTGVSGRPAAIRYALDAGLVR